MVEPMDLSPLRNNGWYFNHKDQCWVDPLDTSHRLQTKGALFVQKVRDEAKAHNVALARVNRSFVV